MPSDRHIAAHIFALVSQPVAAEGLARILESCPELNFFGYCADPLAVGEAIARHHPDILLVDQAFGLRSLFDLLIELRDSGVRSVVWCQNLSAVDRRHLLDAGARGIVEKNHPVTSLVDCFRAVAAGDLWTGARDTATRQADRRSAMRLTVRERQVLALLSDGKKNREIGESLAITPGTVKVHLMHIFEKTGVRNRHELGLQAARLLETQPERRTADRATPTARPTAAGEGGS